jgi:hypothetical protein
MLYLILTGKGASGNNVKSLKIDKAEVRGIGMEAREQNL